MSRVSDLRPPALADAVRGRERIILRATRPGDRDALRDLAGLADRPLPSPEPLLVAEVDGELLAAVSADGRSAVADPFRATADVIELLRLRAGQLRAAA
jgi:hypothetical protein